MQPRRYRRKRRSTKRPLIMAVISVVALAALGAAVYSGQQSKAAVVVRPTPATRNAERRQNLETLAAALKVYIQNHQALAVIPATTPKPICSAATAQCRTTGFYDANFLISTDTGLISLPTDPVGGPGFYDSGYTIARGTDGSIILAAPRTEDAQPVTVSF